MPLGSHDAPPTPLPPCLTCQSLEPVTFDRFGAGTVFCLECGHRWDVGLRADVEADRRQNKDRRYLTRRFAGRRHADLPSDMSATSRDQL